ncbi:hypothetical protein RvY_02124 [Ramazzottius varieornatus]|uniref:Uncharacterized protein n=1 Tax=Ramazzottius varieornatus TaxID=947166 RepID=A0A1D1UM15_RAMVA|nr:hypothetical protein RvY_02124 [Ramazzottius varieornatus]
MPVVLWIGTVEDGTVLTGADEANLQRRTRQTTLTEFIFDAQRATSSLNGKSSVRNCVPTSGELLTSRVPKSE